MFIAFLAVINCDMKIIRLIFDIMSVLRISKNVLLISGVLLRETTNLSKYRVYSYVYAKVKSKAKRYRIVLF